MNQASNRPSGVLNVLGHIMWIVSQRQDFLGETFCGYLAIAFFDLNSDSFATH